MRFLLLVAAAFACSCGAYPQLHDALAGYMRSVPGKPEPELEYVDCDLEQRIADGSGRLEVFTQPRDDVAAAEALALLVEMDRHIGTLCGGSPPPFRLFLRTGVDPEQPLWLIVGVAGEPSAFPLPVAGGPLDESARRQIVRLMTHEWVEQAVLHHYLPFELYGLDPATRWVGDGIAELASAVVCARLGDHGAAQAMVRARIAELKVAMQLGHDEACLDGWLRSEGRLADMREADSGREAESGREGAFTRARYGACLALWWCCFERRQDDLLPAFFEGIRALPRDRVDSAECARVLAQLSGVEVPGMLAWWPLGDAIAVLDRASVKLSR